MLLRGDAICAGMQVKKAKGAVALAYGLLMAACSYSVGSTADEAMPSGTITPSNERDPTGSEAVEEGAYVQPGSAWWLTSQSSGGDDVDLMAPVRVGANLAFNGFDDAALGFEIGSRTRLSDSNWVLETGGVLRAYRGLEPRFASKTSLSLAAGPQGRLYYAGLQRGGLDAVRPWVGLGAGGAYGWGDSEDGFSWYYETRIGVTAQVSDRLAIDVFYSDVESMDDEISPGSTFNVGCSISF
jgi:hypothetical protein